MVVEQLTQEASHHEPHDSSQKDSPKKESPSSKPQGKKGGSCKSTRLIRLVQKMGVELFHTRDQDSYIDIPAAAHREVWRVKSKRCRQWLAGQFYVATKSAIGGQAMQDALNVLESEALFRGRACPVHLRVAEVDGAFYLDLANERWEVIRITSDGWEVVPNAPVRFRRTPGMLPLPTPTRGGSVDLLRSFLNVKEEGAWKLVVAWVLAALRPRGPFPILLLYGEQGAGKSWTASVLRSLIDPNVATLRAEPRNLQDLMIAARNGWILGYDNLSHLQPWLSDGLCRLATGGALSTRELYTDAEEVIFYAQRPGIITSIEEVVTRGDLLDRGLLAQLGKLEDAGRREERLLSQEWEAARPAVLGAFLDVVAHSLGTLPTVTLEQYPRMADFAAWGTAAESSLGWEQGEFLRVYLENRTQAHALAMEGAPIVPAIERLLDPLEFWEGTAAQLLESLDLVAQEVNAKLPYQKSWPRSARALSNQLRRLVPDLRAEGLLVSFRRESTTKRRSRLIHIEKACNSSSASSEHGDAHATSWKQKDYSTNSSDDTKTVHRPDRPASRPLRPATAPPNGPHPDDTNEPGPLVHSLRPAVSHGKQRDILDPDDPDDLKPNDSYEYADEGLFDQEGDLALDI